MFTISDVRERGHDVIPMITRQSDVRNRFDEQKTTVYIFTEWSLLEQLYEPDTRFEDKMSVPVTRKCHDIIERAVIF